MAIDLNWLRNRAKRYHSMIVPLSQDVAAVAGVEAGDYQVEEFVFEANIAFKDAKALSGSELISTELEYEILRFSAGTKGYGKYCQYYRTVYTKTTA